MIRTQEITRTVMNAECLCIKVIPSVMNIEYRQVLARHSSDAFEINETVIGVCL